VEVPSSTRHTNNPKASRTKSKVIYGNVPSAFVVMRSKRGLSTFPTTLS
jgi:hypothetical protein